jgi:hypothetical protein
MTTAANDPVCRQLWVASSGPDTFWKSAWRGIPILAVTPKYVIVADPDGGRDRRVDRATLAANGHATWHIGRSGTRQFNSCVYFDDRGRAAQIAREAAEAEAEAEA